MDIILQLIATREEDFPDHLLDAQERLLQRLDADENDGEALTLLTEVQFWLGMFSGDDSEKESLMAHGVAYGRRAAGILSRSVAANFWYANCMIEHGRMRGPKDSLSCLGPIEEHGNRALELDEAWFDAAPLSMMGRYYCTAPPSPLGPGDKTKGLELAKRAVDLAPDQLRNRVILADAYLSARYFEQARTLLKEVLAAPGPAAFPMSHELHRAQALQILERLERME
jgi:tetratricopeptide (TPR) repeat protein